MNIQSLIALIATQTALCLPHPPMGTWDPEGHQLADYELWMSQLRKAINEMDWKTANPQDFIAHDNFNIADGFNVDLMMVDEMQMIGDPVKPVEKEMQKKRDIEAKRNKQQRDGWFGKLRED